MPASPMNARTSARRSSPSPLGSARAISSGVRYPRCNPSATSFWIAGRSRMSRRGGVGALVDMGGTLLEIGGFGTDRSPLWVVSSREPLFRELFFFLENGLHVRVRVAQASGQRPQALGEPFLPQPADRVVDRARRGGRVDRFVGNRELPQQTRLVRAEPARELFGLHRAVFGGRLEQRGD